MKVGFTGTRHGMSDAQTAAFKRLVAELDPREFHHGDCKGADDDAAKMVCRMFEPDECDIISHPPTRDAWRAFNADWTDQRDPKPYLDRNRDIVDETDVLIAAPESDTDNGGGTWYTMNYARERGKRVVHIKRDGTINDFLGK